MATAPMAAIDAAVNSLRFMFIVLLTGYYFDGVREHNTYALYQWVSVSQKNGIALKGLDPFNYPFNCLMLIRSIVYGYGIKN
jgi:hypothetical protein